MNAAEAVDGGIERMLQQMADPPSGWRSIARNMYSKHQERVERIVARNQVLTAGLVAIPGSSNLGFLVITDVSVGLVWSQGVFSKKEKSAMVNRTRISRAKMSESAGNPVLRIWTNEEPTGIAFSIQLPPSEPGLQGYLIDLVGGTGQS